MNLTESFFSFENWRFLGFLSVVVYFIFDFFDSKRIVDEREELIKLKSSVFSHRLMMSCLSLMSVAFLIYPNMHAFYPIMGSIISSMYGEIIGKMYYRYQL